MKKLAIVLGSFLMVASVNVFAQGRGGNPEERMEKQLSHLKVMLDLTDEQYASIETVMKNSQSEMKVLRTEANKEREAIKEEAGNIKKAEKEEIKSLLSEEQQIKFDEMMAKRDDRMHEKKGKRGGKHRSKSDQKE